MTTRTAELGALNDYPRRPPINWLLHQSEWWRPRNGRLVRIADMDPHWRHNTANMLLRTAWHHANQEGFVLLKFASGPLGPSGDMAVSALEREVDELYGDPEGWMIHTKLYQALTTGLPDGEALEVLQEQARHWPTCPCRSDVDGECACPPERPHWMP